MVGIITGDIINSRDVEVKQWMPELKKVLNHYGSEPKNWEIYRGDSFQLEMLPKETLKAAIIIKSTIKQFKSIDVRMAIGIGEKAYQSNKITESNGSAFIYSGESFEHLKKQTLGIQTGWNDFDERMNLMLELATLTIDNWTPTSSIIVKTALEAHNKMSQKELAVLLQKKQSNISMSLKRSGFYEIQKLIQYFEKEIENRC